MSDLADSQQPTRSSFVTVLAWVFLVITGFTTCISVLQNVMITFFFPVNEMQTTMHSTKGSENLPAFAQFMFSHVRFFFAAFLVLSATMFVSSIALLKRKNWARITFICLLALGIIWNIGGLFLQNAFFSSMPPMPATAPPEFRANFESMATIMLVVSSLFAIGFSVLFGWLIKRLTSANVRAEFRPLGL
jgi:hypothetical protein